MRERERDLGRGGGGGEGVGKEMREFLCNFVFEGIHFEELCYECGDSMKRNPRESVCIVRKLGRSMSRWWRNRTNDDKKSKT